jgi:methylase of polypeptide subunit release factors
MPNNILKYLRQKCSTEPFFIDRLFISTFVQFNNLKVENNKLLKSYIIKPDDIEEYKNMQLFKELITAEYAYFSFEQLIELFEFVISPADKIVSGAVYTPQNIRSYIVDEVLYKENISISNIKIADLACGCGGFLLSAAIKLKKILKRSYIEIYEKHIFGLDIKDYSITRTKLLLSLLAIISGEDREISFNLFVGDALVFDWNDKFDCFTGFDVVIGNPPYVCNRNLDAETRKKIKKFNVCKSGNPDLYMPFFQIGIENLSFNGILGFITMNSFFKSLNGRSLRDYFMSRKIKFKILDFGAEQVFKSHNTYTCICILQKTISEYIEYKKTEPSNLLGSKDYKKIFYINLNSKIGWNLNNNEVISKIESTGKPLGDLYRTSHGIATLKNDIYIFTPINEDNKYYYLEDEKIIKIEKGVCKNIVNTNRLAHNKSINAISEKIIFPYNNDAKPLLYDEKYFKRHFPKSYEYLLSKVDILSMRDKGAGNFPAWYAFGRTQSLGKIKNKLFLPKMSNVSPECIMNSDENTLYYNGQAIIDKSINRLKIIKKIIESRLFWYYISSTSKPYSSNYYSLNGNYIKNFGICDMDKSEEEFLIGESDKNVINSFLEKKYDIFL